MMLSNLHCSFQGLSIKSLHATEQYILHSELDCTVGVKHTIHTLHSTVLVTTPYINTFGFHANSLLLGVSLLQFRQITPNENLCALPECHSVLSSKPYVGDTRCFNMTSNSCHHLLIF